ncbi:MAG: hypothetical protein V1773_15230 [bacterium]
MKKCIFFRTFVILFLFSIISKPNLINAQNLSSDMENTKITATAVNGPGSYKILKTEKVPVKIPFKMHKGKPLMSLEINGKKANLMIDNGRLWDEIWLLGSSLVEELALKPEEETMVGGAGEGDSTQAFNAKNLTLRFDEIIFFEQPAIVSPSAAGFAKMFPGTDGQLCNTFFKHFIVEFDFIKQEILLHDPYQFKYTGNGSILDMETDETGAYSVPFTFTLPDGKVYNNRVDIDLGGIYPLKIALNNRQNIQLPTDVIPTKSFGAQGKSTEFKGKILNMTIGKYKFDSPSAVFGDANTSRIHSKNLGVIGLPLFMKFNTIFDYFNNKIYLTPHENFNTEFEE